MDITRTTRWPTPNEQFAESHPEQLALLDLRYVLTDLMDRPPHRVWFVKELVAVLVDHGFDLGDKPSKAVSDALRTEVVRGRVRRVGWGAYTVARIPGATRRRIRKRARRRWDRCPVPR